MHAQMFAHRLERGLPATGFPSALRAPWSTRRSGRGEAGFPMAPRNETALQVRRSSTLSDEKLVAGIIQRIRDITRRHTVGAAIEVGDVLIEELYGGDLDLAREGRPIRD